jgi:hypothetical protein
VTATWTAPADARPVHGWGYLTPDPSAEYAQLIQVPAGFALAISSLTVSDRSIPDPPGSMVIQLETATPATPVQPGDLLSDVYQINLALGATAHLAFPSPLVLTGPRGVEWALRCEVVATWLASTYAINVLAVGYYF